MEPGRLHGGWRKKVDDSLATSVTVFLVGLCLEPVYDSLIVLVSGCCFSSDHFLYGLWNHAESRLPGWL